MHTIQFGQYRLIVNHFDVDSVVEIPIKHVENGKKIALSFIQDGADEVSIEDHNFNRIYILDNKGTYTP